MLYTRNCELKPGVIFPEEMQRIALGVEYLGYHFQGFQKQKNTEHTIQAHLERALSRIADEALTLVCAGRTDAGVHASEQILHFDTRAQRPTKAWVQGANTHLPEDIRIHWAQPVSPDFHARFSARARTYRYIILSAATPAATLRKLLTWTSWPLDIARMQAAADALIGEHDFTTFRASQCQAASPVRSVHALRFYRQGALIVMEVTANGFLHHMVRNIVGSLMEVGRGAQPVSWLADILQQKNRRLAAATARPWGLYFVKADYPECFHLPQLPLGPIFLHNCR